MSAAFSPLEVLRHELERSSTAFMEGNPGEIVVHCVAAPGKVADVGIDRMITVLAAGPSSLSLVVSSRFRVPEACRRGVALLMGHINADLQGANFEQDPHDGEVRLRLGRAVCPPDDHADAKAARALTDFTWRAAVGMAETPYQSFIAFLDALIRRDSSAVSRLDADSAKVLALAYAAMMQKLEEAAAAAAEGEEDEEGEEEASSEESGDDEKK